MDKKISLIEALSGFQYNLAHISGLNITIKSPKGQSVNNELKLKVPNMGMPYYKDPLKHGDLIITFKVELPNNLSSA